MNNSGYPCRHAYEPPVAAPLLAYSRRLTEKPRLAASTVTVKISPGSARKPPRGPTCTSRIPSTGCRIRRYIVSSRIALLRNRIWEFRSERSLTRRRHASMVRAGNFTRWSRSPAASSREKVVQPDAPVEHNKRSSPVNTTNGLDDPYLESASELNAFTLTKMPKTFRLALDLGLKTSWCSRPVTCCPPSGFDNLVVVVEAHRSVDLLMRAVVAQPGFHVDRRNRSVSRMSESVPRL
jgi:hypothetical protein